MLSEYKRGDINEYMIIRYCKDILNIYKIIELITSEKKI